jgi:hypothetical protein
MDELVGGAEAEAVVEPITRPGVSVRPNIYGEINAGAGL